MSGWICRAQMIHDALYAAHGFRRHSDCPALGFRAYASPEANGSLRNDDAEQISADAGIFANSCENSQPDGLVSLRYLVIIRGCEPAQHVGPAHDVD
jgi:hypothetical protein